MQDGFQWNMMTGGSQGGSHRDTYPVQNARWFSVEHDYPRFSEIHNLSWKIPKLPISDQMTTQHWYFTQCKQKS
jgi:hypothetical protein